MGRKRTTPILDRSKLDPEIRARIQRAAMKLFAARDIHQVGLDEVAREASASLQTIYRYYDGKEELLFACVADLLGELAARVLDYLKGIENYKDRLRKVFWVCLEYTEDHPELAQLIMSSVQLNRGLQNPSFVQPQVTKALIDLLAEGQAKGILTDAVSVPILLDYFWGIVFRLVMMNEARRKKEPLSEQAPVLFDMLWRAMARPETAAPITRRRAKPRPR